MFDRDQVIQLPSWSVACSLYSYYDITMYLNLLEVDRTIEAHEWVESIWCLFPSSIYKIEILGSVCVGCTHEISWGYYDKLMTDFHVKSRKSLAKIDRSIVGILFV